MKTTIIFLVSLLIAQMAWSNPQNQLPEEPWRAIAYWENNLPIKRWKGNISVKLMGNYTTQDSAMVENAIKSLNDLCETIHLSITKHDYGNLKIFYLDSLNKKIYENEIYVRDYDKYNYSSTYDWKEKKIIETSLGINYTIIPQEYKQNFITSLLTKALLPHRYLEDDYLYKRGKEIKKIPESIFLSHYQHKSIVDKYPEPIMRPQILFDQQIIKAVYAANFPTLLTQAKKQYIFPHRWFKDYIFAILLFPLAVALFPIIWLLVSIYKKIKKRIKNELLLFNLTSVITIIMLGVILALYYYTSQTISKPNYTLSLWKIYEFTRNLFIVALPTVNLFRVIEMFIQNKIRHILPKVFLIFLSTSTIPIIATITLVYFTNGLDLSKDDFRHFITILSGFVFIGILRSLISFFILKEKEVKIENEVKLANLRELKTKAELNALHSKINPHFLYNALNSIAGLAKTNADKTEQMALSLSKLFRHSINKEQSDWSTYAEEIEMVTIYLDIEKVRFDDRLTFSVELPEALKAVKVPRFIIQPLVENAIKHGISKVVSQAKISIAVKQIGESIEILVADNGPDFPAELIPGFGLQSIFDKLEIMYPNRFEIHYLNAPNKHILIKLS